MKHLKGLFLTFFLVSTLAACSSNKNAVTDNVENMQKVESATIVAVKTIKVKPEEINSYGNVGVSVGTGGTSGVYGTVDLATLSKLYRNATKPTSALQIIVTKANGETVAITQPATKEAFKVGDTVKVLIVDGKAKVMH